MGKTMRGLGPVLAVAAALVLGAGSASAQRPARSGEEAALRRRVVQLEDRVVRLEHEIATLQAALQEQRTTAALRQAPAPRLSAVRLDRADGWRYAENWRLLRTDMTQVQVRYLLGEPERVAVGDMTTVWVYPAVDGHVGRVWFDLYGDRLRGWVQP